MKKAILYIGNRPVHVDNIYGTSLVWEKDGPPVLVPVEKARLMLRHKDVYAEADGKDVPQPVEDVTLPEEPKEEENTVEEEEENTRHAIRQMARKKPLMEFAKTNFGVDLDDTGKVADLQEQCIRLVDQFGMPGAEE